jgi:alpha-L-arabinofuranosidase
MTTISNESIDAENNFEAQPVSPQTKDIKISKKMTLSVAPYSANVIRLKVK